MFIWFFRPSSLCKVQAVQEEDEIESIEIVNKLTINVTQKFSVSLVKYTLGYIPLYVDPQF